MITIKRKNSFIYVFSLILFLRIVEVVGSFFLTPSIERKGLWLLEGLGVLSDFALFFMLLLGMQFLFRKKGIPTLLHYTGMLIFHVLFFNHLIFLAYFFSQRIPLGRILIMHTYDEIMLTALNSGYPESTLIGLLIAVILFLILLFFFIRKVMRHKEITIPIKKVKKYLLFSFFWSLIIVLTPLTSNNYFVNKSLFFYKEISLYYWEKSHPKYYTYDQDKIDAYHTYFPNTYLQDSFPLLHTLDTTDYLANYFEAFEEKPNVVYLIMEGLNDDYIHPDNGLHLMPYLDSLKNRSLYWENAFTLGERSFAAVPSLIGSLPYGPVGFMQLQGYPRFLSLVSVLKSNDYYTRFNYGLGAWFHSKDNFFHSEGIDTIYDKSNFPKHYRPIIANDGYFWGYDDKSLFRESMKNQAEYADRNYLEVFFSGSMHSPYYLPETNAYLNKLKKMVQDKVTSPDAIERFTKYNKAYITTLFTDDALREFFTEYEKKPNYKNTIFILSGDHPMTDAPIKNSLKRYHVPLMIFSPKLKTPAISKNVVTHLDVLPSIYAILRKYGVTVPKVSTALGQNLKVEGANKNRTLVYMSGHRFVEDIYHDGYFLSKNQLYKIDDKLQIQPVLHPKKQKEMESRLNTFQWMSMFTTTNQNLLPIPLYLEQKKGKQISYKVNRETVQTDVEFFPIEKIVVPENGAPILELYMKHVANVKDLRIVISVRRKENGYYYNPIFIHKDPQTVSQRFFLPEAEKGDEIEVYIWNPLGEKYRIDFLETLIYTIK